MVLPTCWYFSILFSFFLHPLHALPLPSPIPSPLSPRHFDIPIQNFANLSLTSSFISLTDDLSKHKKIKFAVSTHENTVFLGCACTKSAYTYSRESLNDPWEIQQRFHPLTPEENDFGVDVSVNVNFYQPSLRMALIGSPSYKNDTGTKRSKAEMSSSSLFCADECLLIRGRVFVSRNIFRELVPSFYSESWQPWRSFRCIGCLG
jgi:hypothetical protein